MNKVDELVSTLKSMSNQTSLDNLLQCFGGIFDTIANSLIVNCNNSHIKMHTFLILYSFIFDLKSVSSPLNLRSSYLASETVATNDSLTIANSQKLKASGLICQQCSDTVDA